MGDSAAACKREIADAPQRDAADGVISDLTESEEPTSPPVMAPVEIQQGEEDLFYFDTVLTAARSRDCDRFTTGDFTWSARAASADLPPDNCRTPSSVRLLRPARPPSPRSIVESEPDCSAQANLVGASEPDYSAQTGLADGSVQAGLTSDPELQLLTDPRSLS